MTLPPDRLTRFARHIVLRHIGGPGQQRLRAGRPDRDTDREKQYRQRHP